jgi:CBS domain-containing protein
MTPVMTETSAAEAMKPIAEPIILNTTAASARARMIRENISFLVVVSPETREMLGVVLRGALERACEANGHDPVTCPILLHLKTEVDFCLATDGAEEAVRRFDEPVQAGPAAARKARARRSLPVLVVDERKVPVGYLERQ